MSNRAHLAFPITLLVTAALAILPVSWRIGWTREVSDIALFPVRPFMDAGSGLVAWLRPTRSTAEGVPPEMRELVEQLIEDRDVAERLYQAEHQKVIALEQENRDLKSMPPGMRAVSTIVNASVTRRAPGVRLGPVEVRLERGAPHDVPAGTIAVYAGVYLLGRTSAPFDGGLGQLVPVASPDSGLIRAAIFPAEKPRITVEDTVSIHLEPTGSGSFVGDVEHTEVIEAGDLVRVVDPLWPSAQMTVLGRVESVHVNDREPLRHRVTVQPVYQMHEVAAVTLVVEGARAAVGGDGS
jgi:hypothetical protein